MSYGPCHTISLEEFTAYHFGHTTGAVVKWEPHTELLLVAAHRSSLLKGSPAVAATLGYPYSSQRLASSSCLQCPSLMIGSLTVAAVKSVCHQIQGSPKVVAARSVCHQPLSHETKCLTLDGSPKEATCSKESLPIERHAQFG